MLYVCFLWVLLIYRICSCHSYNHVCVLNRDVWLSECVCEAVYAEECVLGDPIPSVLSAFERMLYFLPCMARVCVLESASVLCLCSVSSAVLWILEQRLPTARAFDVSVFVYCGCTALACLDWTSFNSQGRVCQRCLLHPSNAADNLEFISVRWIGDYLRAIRLLGNLSLTPRWFPLSLLPLALMSNS